MNGEFLLDTNVIIPLFRNDPGILLRLESATSTFVPSIAIGELCYGAHRSGHVLPNLQRIRRFMTELEVLACDRGTAEHYGVLKHRLRRIGRPIPENDLWIAALAKQHNLIVATRDHHFQEIETLRTERW